MPVNNFLDTMQTQPVQEPTTPLLQCPKCKGTWFEQRLYSQIDDTTMTVVGQPPSAFGPTFVLLICGRCDEKLEPRLLRQTRDNVDKKYDEFYEEMNKTVKTDTV